MRILIVYATTEGQTRKIARHIANYLAQIGHSVELLNVDDAANLDLTQSNAAILAGSVHAGRYQSALCAFAKEQAATLATMPNLFLSVSLTAAAENPDDHAELARIAAHFVEVTGWNPRQIAQVAGALRFSEYSFFTYWAMRWIGKNKDQNVTGKTDIEYTDWEGLSRLIKEWSDVVSAGR